VILALSLPKISDRLVGASIHRVLVEPGQEIKPGTPIVEVRADLGSAGDQDCPPIQYFRIVATERGYLGRTLVALGDALGPGAPLALATTSAGESCDGPIARPMRSMSVAIRIDPLSQ
jgi:hypothetical protein